MPNVCDVIMGSFYRETTLVTVPPEGIGERTSQNVNWVRIWVIGVSVVNYSNAFSHTSASLAWAIKEVSMLDESLNIRSIISILGYTMCNHNEALT